MYTPYGFFVFISFIVGYAFINGLSTWNNVKFFVILVVSIFSQRLWCGACAQSYSFTACLVTIPLLVSVLFDCANIRMLIFAFALACAIGRIGCYFAGCCTGKITDAAKYTIQYTKGVVNQKTFRPVVNVYPTVLIEIVLQFLIAFVVYYHKYGVLLYGIFNIALLFVTTFWRDEPRISTTLTVVPVVALLAFSSIVFARGCYSAPLTDLKFKIKLPSVGFGAILGWIVSNNLYADALKI